jgi:7,8-dihydro-6-hydroxymethylpterin-pyrophosphokinase
VNNEIEACAARLDAISEARRALETRALERTPEYRQIATEWDRANEALYAARKRAGDSSHKFTAEMVYVGHTDVTEEEMLEFIESRERALKRMREIVGGDYEGGE